MTAEGYVLEATPLSGGIGGWHQGPVMVVKLGDLPEGPAVATVQTEMDDRLTVRQPPEGMPAGEVEPWTRMPVEHQILAARTALGLSVEVIDGPHNELWRVQGCPQQLTSEVAWWLFGGEYRSWEGRARPVFRETRLDEAIAAGRLQADLEQRPLEATDRAASADQANEGTVEPHEQLAGGVDKPEAPAASSAGEPAGPEDAVVPARQARLAKALDDFGPRYTSHNTNGYIGDGSVVRYVVDGHVKEGVTEAERRWMKKYVDTHPEILTTKPLRPEELDARDRAASDALSERARQAVDEGRFDEALHIIDEAEPLYSHVEPWAEHRIWVSEAAEAAAAQPAEPEQDSPDTDQPAPVDPGADTPAAVEMTATQRYVASELAKAQTPYSSPKSRLEVYWQLDSWATLPQSVQDGLVADLHGIVTDGEPRERSAARRLLDRWLGADVGHSDAQSAAVAAARVGSLASDAARVATYGQLSAAEYAALEPVHQEAIEADLQAIATSSATQTIPSNRTSMGMTIRGVTANHVETARALLARIAAGPRPFTSNAAKVDKGVFAQNLNPGDRIIVSGREATVDRVGLDRKAYLQDGRTLSDRRYKLVEAAPAPPTPDGPQPDDLAATPTVTPPSPDNSTATPHDSDLPAAPVDDQPRLTAREEAIIRNAVDDHAAGYYGGPLRLPKADVPRDIADGHLEDLEKLHGRDAIWAAVAEVIGSDENVLHRSHADRERLRVDRENRAEKCSRKALAAFQGSDYDQALTLVEQGELIDPLYRPNRSERRPYGLSWSDIRATIASRRDGGQAAAAPASPAPSGSSTTLPAAAAQPSAVPIDGGAGAGGGQPVTAAQLARLDTTPGAHVGTVAPARPQGAYSSTAPTARTGPSV
jgi:hypothetical protein